ncbi:MAG TPA: glycosyltransferase family 39 protein [Geodermatophilus sp.]|nr:glycosyltransferase family 39 protein [Geodermatophilus sp.]
MGSGRRRVALTALALAAGTAAVLLSWWLFPLYSVNRDDSVYVAMARLLEHGQVTLSAADHEFFRPWASGQVGDRVVLKYTPPWPSVLALADAVTGSPRLALGLVAAATVVVMALLAGEVLRDRTAGVVAGVLLALSPGFLLQSATYLPYVFQLLLGLGFAALLLVGVRRRSSARVVAAGAVWGVAAFARPFDAVLFAAPFVLVVLLDARRAAREGAGWTWLGIAVRLAAGALPLLAVSLLYNAAVMGSPLRLPFTVTGPQDGFGFGRRGVFPQFTVPFEPGDGVAGMLANLRWTPSWVFGGVLLVALAVVGLVRATGRARWAVAGLAVTVPLGYLPFWGPYAMSHLWAGVQSLGPYYHLPVLVPLVTFGAASLVALVRSASAYARPAAAALVAGLVLLTALAVPDKVAANLAVRDDYRAVQHFVAGQDLDSAVLLLPRRGDLGFVSSTPFLENDPSLRQPVLYAEDRGATPFELLDRYPDRPMYRLSEDLPPGETTGGRLSMDLLRVDAGPVVTLRVRLTNPTDRPVAVAYLTDGRTVWSRPLDEASTRGRTYEVSWTVAAPGAAAASSGEVVRLPAGRSAGVLAVGFDLRRAGEASEQPGCRWERRMAYRLPDGTGRVELLRPGQGWARDDAPGSQWLQANVGNPVEELG